MINVNDLYPKKQKTPPRASVSYTQSNPVGQKDYLEYNDSIPYFSFSVKSFLKNKIIFVVSCDRAVIWVDYA